jgi:hypothetical protein
MDTYLSNRNCGCLRCRVRGIMGAVVLLTIGFLFLIENFSRHDLNFGRTWPLLLIAIGVVKMLQRSASTEGHVQPPVVAPPFPMPPPAPPVSPVPPPPMQGTGITPSSTEVRHE